MAGSADLGAKAVRGGCATAWKGFLIDVGGVLRVGPQAVPGASQALATLRAAGVPFRLLSNTSSRSRAAMAADLAGMGLPVGPEEILTATTATAVYLREVGGASLVLASPSARADLEGLPEAGEDAAHVVLGDTDLAFTRAAMNRAFRALRGGADLVAMARNRWFATPRGPAVDIGAVVAALEYAADVRAILVGKPAAPFFAQGVAALGLRPSEVAMVGDDPEADVLGAQAAGLGGVYVGGDWGGPGSPDAVLASVAGLPRLAGVGP